MILHFIPTLQAAASITACINRIHSQYLKSNIFHHYPSAFRSDLIMQMAGYVNGKEISMSDPLYTCKFQTLETNIPHITNSSVVPLPYAFCFQQQTQTHLPPLNHHSASMITESQQCKRKFGNEPVNWASSRWNPTPEQLQCLEELYCSGTRTPTAKQIQQIAAKLRRFGKIEGKNVFYWFQNHKSRERQKQLRKMKFGLNNQGSIKKQPGFGRAGADHRRAKNWASLSNSCTSSEESVLLTRAVAAVCNADKGTKFKERQRELQLRGSRMLTENARWQKMEFPPVITSTSLPESYLETRGQMLVESQIFNALVNLEHVKFFQKLVEEERRRESQTLQLFPVSSQVRQIPNTVRDDVKSPIPALTTNFTPIRFYEFFV